MCQSGQKDECVPTCSFDTSRIIWPVSETSTYTTYCRWSSWHNGYRNFPLSFPAVGNAGLGWCVIRHSFWPFFVHPRLNLYFPSQLPQNRLFHILTQATWWLACLFSKFLHTIHVSSRLSLDWILMKSTSHWLIQQMISLFPKYQSPIQRITELEGTSGQHCTWTSLDETLQDILLDVCPSIHLWKITVIDWEMGPTLNIMYLETDVQHITVTQREPSRPYDSSSNVWCSNWHLRQREKCVQIKLSSWIVWGPTVMTEKRKITAGEQPRNFSWETTSRALGTTMCCLEYQHKQSKCGWTGRCPEGSHSRKTLASHHSPVLPGGPAFLRMLNKQHFSLSNFLAAISLWETNPRSCHKLL